MTSSLGKPDYSELLMVTSNYWHVLVRRQIGWAEVSFQQILYAKKIELLECAENYNRKDKLLLKLGERVLRKMNNKFTRQHVFQIMEEYNYMYKPPVFTVLSIYFSSCYKSNSI